MAKDLGLTVIDLYSAFKGKETAFTDADHLQVSAHVALHHSEGSTFKYSLLYCDLYYSFSISSVSATVGQGD